MGWASELYSYGFLCVCQGFLGTCANNVLAKIAVQYTDSCNLTQAGHLIQCLITVSSSSHLVPMTQLAGSMLFLLYTGPRQCPVIN
jgi:hypothetical protein